MQQKDEKVKASHGCFPFRKKRIKRNQTVWRNKKFREVGWNLKDQKDSKKETSRRLTKHHEPKRQSKVKTEAMSI